jgi:hypothetical protein
MLKSFNFRRSLGGQPREGVVHGPNPCTHCRPLPLPKSSPQDPPSLHFAPHLPLPPPFLPPFPLALEGGRTRGGRHLPWWWPEGGGPPLVLPSQRLKKTIGAAYLFFYNSKLNFFPLKGITLAHLPLKFQNFIHVFDAVRAYLNSPKTHLQTLVL